MKSLGQALLVLLFSLGAEALWACPTCGQSFSFTPKLMLVSAGFFLLPVALVLWVAWKVWRSEKNSSSNGD